MELPREQWDKPTTSRFFLVLVLLGAIGLFGWVFLTAQDISLRYDETMSQIATNPVVASVVTVGEKTVTVPTWTLFHTQNIWQLISPQRQLAKSFTPTLTPITVAAASDGDMRLNPETNTALTALFAAAENDGVHLMVASAYRSADDQQKLYDSFLQTKGKAYVMAYVAQPGASEHQTGYAVDISSASPDCQKNSNNCQLVYDAISWLRSNAANYGFIQRYPSGKQSITGVTGEEWHYRYVGKPLATALETSNLTLDEFVQQTAPGYARTKQP